ncbi:MAG: DNA-3-methyladenine glycosylase 2 family protein [Chloroflexi bacterium AL-W]|nr:DNA-3-methyladenine glycosylase 2 family protein [Chloroflexi bacterium AL-N1]NOK69624.1 DNA-3-methyladenine glycosylase 2 family protein [Chloroflexi bacterium AL-N10]NOK72171.1 DNA-3-methyladenine glycosylase 2 family protein [Chloroflexi bacterium AL-N5]NOK85000.1 DNA-3-methyladenine glycosylase 2 family protein [Chloroflexi bacterium AL-W]NOK91753.1 DNA-3-methyladenine glycosylase 2 family protein [Chloroflexi bacterium AL-N15]
MDVGDRQPGPATLTEAALSHGLGIVAARDPDLADILERWGPPPLWDRPPGFPTLVHIILEQQVSLASAQAAFTRLCDAVTPLTPEGFLTLDDQTLKAIGFSRQKTAYGRYLATVLVEGQLDLVVLEHMDDAAVRSELMKLKGIGRWTADMYLLMVLCRPDIWPSGDLALAIAVQEAKGLDRRPSVDELDAMSTMWQPWRAVATRLFWHAYLSTRRQRTI